MKTSINHLLLILLSTVSVALSGCESFFDNVFDRDADYDYIIQNNASAAIRVEVKVKSNTGTITKGDPYFTYEIKPGDKVEVWATSGFTEDTVWNEEEDNATLYWFEITSATMEGMPCKVYLNSPKTWKYKKESDYKASYTLRLADADFY